MDKERTKQIMGQVVQQLREEKGMSRYALAKAAGVDNSWLRRFEQGRSGIRVETLILLAQGLELSSCYIMGKIENEILKDWE